jgi:hypothetical protein
MPINAHQIAEALVFQGKDNRLGVITPLWTRREYRDLTAPGWAFRDALNPLLRAQAVPFPLSFRQRAKLIFEDAESGISKNQLMLDSDMSLPLGRGFSDDAQTEEGPLSNAPF